MKALVVVDYEYDFVSSDGKLSFPQAVTIEGAIAEKVRNAKAEGTDVIFIRDAHGRDYMDTQEGRNLPFIHCDTEKGKSIYGKVGELSGGCPIYDKGSFGSVDLFEKMRSSDYTDVEICGVMTDICVLVNAALIKTALPEAVLTVDSRAVATNSDEKQKAALSVLKSIQVNVLE